MLASKGGAMKRFTVLVVVELAISLVVLTAPAPAATYTKVVRYGPFSLPAATDAGPGMIHNQLKFAVERPCLDCFITGFTPDLVYPDGTRATMATGAMLHHFVLTSQFRSDATCGNAWLGLAGERFFASGDERTVVSLPSGYGYRVRWYDSWNLLVDLMNHTTEPKTVYLKVTYTYRPAWESVARLDPDDHHSVQSMSTCSGDPLARIAQGDIVRLHSEYHSSDAANDVMGI